MQDLREPRLSFNWVSLEFHLYEQLHLTPNVVCVALTTSRASVERLVCRSWHSTATRSLTSCHINRPFYATSLRYDNSTWNESLYV